MPLSPGGFPLCPDLGGGDHVIQDLVDTLSLSASLAENPQPFAAGLTNPATVLH